MLTNCNMQVIKPVLAWDSMI
ncbi:TPA: conserved hypothetical protein [Aspergillus nidulans FGSC A4]|uniref:Uncharacterized protein n=1 Tax=Emericella nidulans (strain FGSC A4 / ATCC 38163 / CBS 112.46 / NRRL 194 / M139) TaxID=227321 RepID=C8VGN8_EMENI|nr:TPA: conserved hypothetical protein [Aspergillus nidulans FGSC A4]